LLVGLGFLIVDAVEAMGAAATCFDPGWRRNGQEKQQQITKVFRISRRSVKE
jgi:hypothetical protein